MVYGEPESRTETRWPGHGMGVGCDVAMFTNFKISYIKNQVILNLGERFGI